MNHFLVALIGVIAVFAVGYVFYGVVFKKALAEGEGKMELMHVASSVVLLYIMALFFVALYSVVSFGDGSVGLAKGVHLGLMVGVGFFVLPLYVDAPFFKARTESVTAVLLNWLVSFVVLGAVVGLILN